MPNVIREILSGELENLFESQPKNPEAAEASKKCNICSDKLFVTLSKKQQEMFFELEEANNNYEYEVELDRFSLGFRYGIRLMLDVFAQNNASLN